MSNADLPSRFPILIFLLILSNIDLPALSIQQCSSCLYCPAMISLHIMSKQWSSCSLLYNIDLHSHLPHIDLPAHSAYIDLLAHSIQQWSSCSFGRISIFMLILSIIDLPVNSVQHWYSCSFCSTLIFMLIAPNFKLHAYSIQHWFSCSLYPTFIFMVITYVQNLSLCSLCPILTFMYFLSDSDLHPLLPTT